MGTANAVNTGEVQVTCTNGTFGTGWDNDNPYFNGKGNIAALYCDVIHHTGYVSDNLTNDQLRWYQGVVIQDTPTATTETQTVVAQETSTSSAETSTPDAPVSITQTDSPTVVLVPDSSTLVEPQTPIVLESSTSESSTQTSQSETSTPIVEIPLPTPPPVVEPQPVPIPVVVVPQPEPLPQPEPEPLPPVIDEEAPSEESVPSDEPVSEEPVPVEEPSEYPEEEDTNEIPVDDVIQEQPEPTPDPSPEPNVEPEVTSPVDIAPEPPVVQELVQVNNVDLASLPPDTPVQLENGVIITAEVAIQVALLQDPGELLSELFTDPGAALAALGSVGADMSPESRQKSKDAVVQAVVVGSIITQAAGAAAYRRKP